MRYRNNKKDKQEQIRLKITEVQIPREPWWKRARQWFSIQLGRRRTPLIDLNRTYEEL